MARRSTTTTIADVARHAGVSPATVSRVMNGNFLGEPDVAERVRTSARELAYSPSPLARSLALGETHTVALLVPDIRNPAFQAILGGLTRAAARDGYRVLVADSAEMPDEEPVLATELRRRCDSVVLCAPRMPEQTLVELAASLSPVVLINRPSPSASAPSLSIDYGAGITELARHLYGQGHRTFIYLGGPERSVSNARRRRALDEFEEATPDVVLHRISCGADTDDGRRVASLVKESGATAAIAFNDLVAVGLVDGLTALGVRVPDDISVTGFDDIPFARYTSPPLTTASVPYEELGVQAWQRLFALIRGEAPGDDVVFQPRVEVRRSTAPAPVATAG
ncbi:LacI family DNA-binding transcriptional regulator [Agromyces bauzanensis]